MKEYLLGKINIEIPEAFLKRWIKKQNEDTSDEEIENNFENYRKDIKWQLIKNKLVKEHEMSVSEDEVKELTKELTKMQFLSYGLSEAYLTDDLLENQVNEALNDENTIKQLYERKYEEKVKDLVKENVTLDTQDITKAEFDKLNEQNQ